MNFRSLQRLEGPPSFGMHGWVIICDLSFERTKNHNFTITTNMSQHVEFFHPLIFCKIWTIKLFTNKEQIKLLNSKSTDLDWYYSIHYWNSLFMTYYSLPLWTPHPPAFCWQLEQPQRPFQPLATLMASPMEWLNNGIVPGKIMKWPATVRLAALWITL